MRTGKHFINGIFILILLVTAMGNTSLVAQAGNGNDELKADPRLLQMAEENPDATFMVIVQREIRNKDVQEDDPEADVEKEGGRVKKQFRMVESFSAELTGKQILKLAKKRKVRWISADAPMVSTAAPGMDVALDNFTSASYSGSNGTVSWGSNWTESGETTSATGGYLRAVSNSACSGASSYCLRIQPYSSGRYIYRKLNMDGGVSASLSFYRNNVLTSGAGAIALEISNNGGSTWTTLRTYSRTSFLGSATDTFDIAAYASANTWIRFRITSTQTSTYYTYFDNIQILYARASAFLSATKADQLGLNGNGVTVAVIDSGITSNHADFMSNGNSRVIASTKFGNNITTEDLYGHGTHVAGTIGGNGASSAGKYRGMAPGVNLINLKVSNELGMTYESDVVNAMQWVYDNRSVYNIKVVNLSMNSTVAQSYHTSPLSAAVEILWFNGIVVVVSAGNNGTADGPSTVYPPANDPFVITVGATEDKGTTSLTDDTMAVFSAYSTAQSGSLDIRISSSSDDAEEEGADGASLGSGGMYLDSSDLEFMRDNEEPRSGTQTIGLRFNGVSLPQGATITNAYLRFTAILPDSGNSNSGIANFTIQGLGADSATPFTTAFFDLSNRSRTTATVQWTPATWTSGTMYDSPNLTTIVQEIVNRPGWTNGNSMALIIRCTDGVPTTDCRSRSADSWDGNSLTAPLLHVEWTGGVAKPDLVAPGRNVVAPLGGLVNLIFQTYPLHRVNDYYFRMSGTSMSAPVVSGAVALLLQDEPNLTPDQVKYRLVSTANKSWTNYNSSKAGAGTLDIYAAVNGTSTQSANTGITVSQMLTTGSNPVTWGSVGWNSVGWNSVGWNSVGWNSVGWNSVGWNSVGWSTSTWDK